MKQNKIKQNKKQNAKQCDSVGARMVTKQEKQTDYTILSLTCLAKSINSNDNIMIGCICFFFFVLLF